MRTLSWLGLSLALLAAPAGATDGSWRMEKERDGVQISTRAVEGWSIREIRGTMRFPGRLSAVVATLCDIDATAELNDLTTEARVVQRDSDTHYRFYTAMKLTWPVSDRDIVAQRQITQDPATQVVIIDDAAAADAVPPRKNYVRMERSHQVWTLTPSGREVVVEMRALTDPNGPIPAAIVNLLAVDAPMKTLVKLRQLAQAPRYADARLDFIKDPADH